MSLPIHFSQKHLAEVLFLFGGCSRSEMGIDLHMVELARDGVEIVCRVGWSFQTISMF